MRHREVKRHIRRLDDIRQIINSMKNIAIMESHKLSKYLITQRQVVQNIEEVAADFKHFYPEVFSSTNTARSIYILIGSERGFCGNYNETLLEKYNSIEREAGDTSTLIVVGNKLANHMGTDAGIDSIIDGAFAIEEVQTVLLQLSEVVSSLVTAYGLLQLNVIYHDLKANEVVKSQVLPPFVDTVIPIKFPYPPGLNMIPRDFARELVDQYIYARLHQILYASLMAENDHRYRHLDSAVRRLDEKGQELDQHMRFLRQEEIIEEIEVILLSAESVAQK